MYIKNLKLKNFRNYENLDINFHENFNILIGENGQGKTNILESIYYIATSKSPRTLKIENLINSNNENFFLEILINRNDNFETINHFYNRNSDKEIKLNKKNIKFSQLLGKILFVYFCPDDMLIIKGDSSFRRKLLDFVLFQIFPNYKFFIKEYNDLLLKRNHLLKDIKFNKSKIKYLEEWTFILAKSGIKIYEKRREFIQILNKFLENYKIFFDILYVKYNSFLYENSIDEYLEKLKLNYDKDINFGYTSIGPQKDDLEFMFNNLNIKIYGSQGQQRLYILTLKILIADIIKYFTNENPILIFDDVFSELDEKNIKKIVHILKNKYQTFISTVSIDKIQEIFNFNKSIFYIQNGNIINGTN